MIGTGLKEVNHRFNKLIDSISSPVMVEAGSYCFRRKTFFKEKQRKVTLF